MSYMEISYEELNFNMKVLLPETADNDFADYPMTGGNKWLVGKDKVPGADDKYCFIKTEENKMPKGKGPTGYEIMDSDTIICSRSRLI